MKRFWKQIPRGWKLAADLGIILVILVLCWMLLDYPLPTAAAAYRRAVEDAGLPAPKLELQVNGLSIGSDEKGTYIARLRERNGWGSYDAWYIPAAGRIRYAPLEWSNDHFPYELDEEKLAFAVKAPGETAELTLILEDWTKTIEDFGERESTYQWYGGRYPLVFTERQDDWFLFSFDNDYLRSVIKTDHNGSWWYEQPEASYVYWINNYKPWLSGCTAPARLELVTYDAEGNIQISESWTLAPDDRTD